MSASVDFVHLHVHSHFSMEDGVPGVHELARRARDLGMRALALTDHNTLGGIVEFCCACREAGIRPIIGCQLDIVPFGSKSSASGLYSLVFLVENEPGYRSLVALINRAYASAKDGRPRLRIEDLEGNVNGLIALTGGSSSELFQLLSEGKLQDTEAHVTRLARVFGKENVVFEIQDHNLPKQHQICERIYSLSDFLSMRCVATNDVHYVRPEDSICHEFLKAEVPPTFFDFHARRDGAHTRHLASGEEMQKRFEAFPRAIFAAAEVAERCAFQPNFDKKRFPVHDFVRGFDADSFLWDLTFREARGRFAELSPEMKNRLNEEFDYIKNERLSNNILLLWNIAQYCRKNKINMGVGRGSMISSLVSYILGITQINPLDYKLRFLGFEEAQHSQPCLSVEVPAKHSGAIREFLKQTFGADFCSHICRYSNYTRQTLLRDICTWFNFRSSTKLESFEGAENDTRDGGTSLESFFGKKADGVALPNSDIVRYMLTRLLPRPKALNVVENQFAISAENLNHLVARVPMDDELVTQLDESALDRLKIPRLKLESNALLDVLDTAAAWVRVEENAAFDPDRIPLDDADTYDLLCRGLTNGIDPFHPISLKSLLRMHRPRNFMALVRIKSMERAANGEKESDIEEHLPECLMSYRCAFIKAHYPISFMAAMLTHSYHNRKKFTVILREAKQMGVRVLPPDINLSMYEFSHVHKAIRTGLMVVSGMKPKTFNELARVRKSGDFHDLIDLCRRTDARLLSNRLLSNLVKTGALDCFKFKRSQMLQMVEEYADAARKGGNTPGLFDEQQKHDPSFLSEAPDVEELSLPEIIKHEIASAGYCISFDQLHLYKDLIRKCRAVSPYDLGIRMVGREVYLAGFLEHVENCTSLAEERDQVLLDLEGHVVSLPIKASKLYEQALKANAPVLVGGTVQRRKDEVYVKALTAFTLRMVQQMSQQVLQLELDLSGEDARTLRLIARLVSHYRGGSTKMVICNFSGSALWSWHVSRIHKMPVFFSPPFYYALKKILPEDRISLVASQEMDPELLHALSPLRFPRPESRSAELSDLEANSEVVDAY